ncbi:MAG: hypothetical protein COB15_10800 [Flavobacteriales bacterium]|nr:MAG: hypothetical protein COB15_10800 [Flavobacteriales bacterium]
MKKILNHIISSNNFLSLIGQGIFALVGFGSLFLLTRSFSVEEFGVWILYLTAVTMVGMLRDGFLQTGLIRFISGVSKTYEKSYIGSSWVCGSVFTLTCILVIMLISIIDPVFVENSHFKLFFMWSPLFFILTMPYNYALSILQARMMFGKIIILRLIHQLSFFSFIIYNFFTPQPIEYLIYAHLICSSISSLYAITIGYSGVQYFFMYKKRQITELFNFGKYSAGTLLGTSLLKSSDIFIIGIFMGPAAAAFYSIPLKLIEMFEIILRSFVSVALPILSKASIKGNIQKVEHTFYKYTGVLTIIYIPIVIACFFLAEDFIIIFAGETYAHAAIIFRIFLIYALFLPIDRFTGVTLDSINQPEANLIKVSFMVVANVLGDLLAIYLFNEVWAVAIVTITTVLIGVFLGIYFLNRTITLSCLKIIPIGTIELKLLLTKFLFNQKT